MIMRIIPIILLASSIVACQPKSSLEAQQTDATIAQTVSIDEFEQKLVNAPDAQLLDVRTPTEFAQGHLANAININIGAPNFTSEINNLDINKPVFVYCLTGVRSYRAAAQLQRQGFKVVYDMQGGIMKWLNAGKSLNASIGASKGLSVNDFNNLINSDKYILVDYNAKWCEPCKKMLPILESYAIQQQDKLALLKIDADEHRSLILEKGIESVPYLELYKNGQLVWKHNGFIDAQTLHQEMKL